MVTAGIEERVYKRWLSRARGSNTQFISSGISGPTTNVFLGSIALITSLKAYQTAN